MDVVVVDREVRCEGEAGLGKVALAATRSGAERMPGSSSTSRLLGMTVDSMGRQLRKGWEYQCQLRRRLSWEVMGLRVSCCGRYREVEVEWHEVMGL